MTGENYRLSRWEGRFVCEECGARFRTGLGLRKHWGMARHGDTEGST